MTARGPDIFVAVDHDRGLALVYGRAARRITWLLSPTVPRWSGRGRGWVLPAELVADVQAYAEQAHLVAVVHDRKTLDQAR